MIFGVFSRRDQEKFSRQRIEDSLAPWGVPGCAPKVCVWNGGALGYRAPFPHWKYEELRPFMTKDGRMALVMSGRIYNERELWSELGDPESGHRENDPLELLLQLYVKFDLGFVRKLNGKFVFAIWDQTQGRMVLGRDRIGIEPLYYWVDDHYVVFGSCVQSIFTFTGQSKALHPQGLARYLLFNYNPGFQTIYEGIHRLRSAHLLSVGPRDLDLQQYWKLSFKEADEKSEESIAEQLLDHLRRAVNLRLDEDENPGIFVSGGMDSSSILGLTKETVSSPLNTYSYRCHSESYDESCYARRMAEFAQSRHHEIGYEPREVLCMPEIVKAMNEPFCDVGINIATYILGREASHRERYIFTGDGGDELFGGHPIYEADKVARYAERLPLVVKNMLHAFLAYVPDSDQKKPLSVKLKRFFESCSFPPELLSHRWRIYYQMSEVAQLILPEFAHMDFGDGVYQDILDMNVEGDGEDLLSQSLYSDYQTIVEFYLRRNDLNRLFNLETRYPLFDHQLVEFCASLPSHLKIRGWFDTKYIFKKTMETVLPHDIVHRDDKLGHSIPLKNWLRERKDVQEFVLDYLSVDVLKRRRMFHVSAVQSLIAEHMEKRRNNSHRLWGLAVLEMWMQEHVDRGE